MADGGAAGEKAAAAGEGDALGEGVVAAIVALSLGIFAIGNDFTAMGVALPAIEQDFGADVAVVQWVVNGYALIFGVLIVPGGRLADMFGRRNALFVGAALFAGFSLMGALAPNIWVLIAARLLQGLGGALMWPAILGLFYAILPASRAALAGGIVIGVAGTSNAAGPMVGGVLTQEASWRWILAVNLPIAAIAMLVTWRTVHITDADERQPIDYVGIACLSTGLIALLIALGQAPDEGWASPIVVGPLVLSAVLLVAFYLRERRTGEAGVVPPSVMANRPFVFVCAAVLAMSVTFFAALFFLPQYFQKILGYDALIAGVAMLPMMGVFAIASFSEGWLVGRIGMKAVITVGALLMCLGISLIPLLMTTQSGYWRVVPGMVLMGAGIGLFYSAVTTAGITLLDPAKSSLAGGILYMCQIAGGAIGLGITTTVFLAGANRGIANGASDAGIDLTSSEVVDVRDITAGTDTLTESLSSFTGDQLAQLTEVARDSFVTGMRWALALDALATVVGLVLAATKVAGPLSRFGRDQGVEATAG